MSRRFWYSQVLCVVTRFLYVDYRSVKIFCMPVSPKKFNDFDSGKFPRILISGYSAETVVDPMPNPQE